MVDRKFQVTKSFHLQTHCQGGLVAPVAFAHRDFSNQVTGLLKLGYDGQYLLPKLFTMAHSRIVIGL
jgi:hypothetical protein